MSDESFNIKTNIEKIEKKGKIIIIDRQNLWYVSLFFCF